MLRYAVAVGIAIAAFSAAAVAQDYPTRQVEVIIPFSPGGSVDTHGRLLADQLSKDTGIPFVVLNKPGGNGAVAAAYIKNAPADGYKILYNSSSLVQSFAVSKNPGYDIKADFLPVAFVADGPHALVISSARYPKIKTIKDFVAYFKEHPKELSFSSGGVGNVSHLMGISLLKPLGLEINHVAYVGGTEAVTAILSSEVTFTMSAVSSLRSLIKDGLLTALVVTTRQRVASVPDVPTIDETVVPGYDASSWHGVVVRSGTPREIVDKLNARIQKALADPNTEKKFFANDFQPRKTTPEEYGAFLKLELDKTLAAMKDAGVEPQ